MVMSKMSVTRYRRRRYARRYRRYRSLSNQYFRAKIEGIYTIAFPSVAGDPVFAETEKTTIDFFTIFNNSQYYASLTAMFGYMKVYGISMEVTPGPTNYKGTATVGAKTLVGFRFGFDSPLSYHQLVADDNSILLGVDTTKRRYVSTMGATDWLTVSSSNSGFGVFGVASSITGTLANQPTWTCRFSLYMLFKKTNV